MQNVSKKDQDVLLLSTAVFNARQMVNAHFDSICNALEVFDLRANWLKFGGMWPCLARTHTTRTTPICFKSNFWSEDVRGSS
ncbi:hypothetical protein K432DRAFT_192246 [Lepidopterella palustris CBS 459.81]|uniref:Uncharacterized protein n=1 Tax=Lepidopterella palustris CBS 459.81 TaxID=1314670 RepID=A0A8E2EFN8_9PEZI|nr:hypothetical protein K432DRAFT_192246 [Lepidopterella palustris CBS 459.81]